MSENFWRTWDNFWGLTASVVPWTDDGVFVRQEYGSSEGARGFPVPLGKVRVTPCARRALRAAGVAERQILLWHAYGNFGDITDREQRSNEESLQRRDGSLIASRYVLPTGGAEILVSSAGSYTGRCTTFVFMQGD